MASAELRTDSDLTNAARETKKYDLVLRVSGPQVFN